MSHVHRQKLQVRQKGGKLPSKWGDIFMVLHQDHVAYYMEKNDVKSGNAQETIPLADVTSVQAVGESGTIFELRAGNIRIQHQVPSEEHRDTWTNVVMQQKGLCGNDSLKKERQEFFNEMSPKELAKFQKNRADDYQMARNQILDKAVIDKTLILEVLMEREIKQIRTKHQESIAKLEADTQKEKSQPAPS